MTTHAIRYTWIGLLAAGLLMLGLSGCDSGGANRDEGGDNGDGETVVPVSPNGLEASSGDGEVGLSWDAVQDAETYNVYRDTESGVDVSGSPMAEGIGETTYTDQAVDNGSNYYYVVTGVGDEEGDPSGEAEGAPFAPPSGLEGTSGDSQIELSWEAAAGAETYSVYRDTTSGVDTSGDPLADTSEAAYTDRTAENGTNYYFVVTSVNSKEEESTESSEIEKTAFSAPRTGPERTIWSELLLPQA